MTLNEWSSIPESRQHELIIEWHKNNQWEVYYDMAEEAAKALKTELKSIPEVTNVTPGGGKILFFEHPAVPIIEPILVVCTPLPENSKLQQLPTRFLGFHVKQVNFGDKRDAFLKALSCILKELKGWNETEILKWGSERNHEPLLDSLNGGYLSTPIYSCGPVTMAVEILINEYRNELLAAGNHPSKLLNPIRSIIWDALKKAGAKKHNGIDEIPNFDWNPVRNNIKELFEKACSSVLAK